MTVILQANILYQSPVRPTPVPVAYRPLAERFRMTVRIGINPITWTNDDLPALGGDTPLETCLAETRQAGYAGIELGNKFPRRAEALRPILDRHGLAPISGWYSGRLLERSVDKEIAAVEDHLTLLAALGCKVMVFAETTDGIGDDRAAKLS